ncbi:hypothetical protein ABZ362_19340 [Streptomyces sp. NPDC005951]|uniref:DUF2071 domain-containing protein n=1 Tax=Streptomyces sp. NPDC005951 TaxID=3154573 RepID=UPI0033C40095
MIRPRLSSVIERRLMVNYRVDPYVAAALLPAPLRPQLVRGHAVAGICLLRIGGVRPARAPAATGLTSENAAHRIAVEWDGPDGVERGLSPNAGGTHLDVLELSTDAWKVTAGRPRHVRSSFFEDLDRFPPGSTVLDSALVMRGVAADWSQGEALRVGAGVGTA